MKCLICGKSISRYQLYCKDPHCQQAYLRKVAIVHNTKEYRQYMVFYRFFEEEAYLRGDIEK